MTFEQHRRMGAALAFGLWLFGPAHAQSVPPVTTGYTGPMAQPMGSLLGNVHSVPMRNADHPLFSSSDRAPLAGRSNPSNNHSAVKSISFGRQRLDQTHTIKWRHWTIGFGSGQPTSEFDDHGMKVRGLRCTEPGIEAVNCHLFLAMAPFESHAHFCQLAPDDKRAFGFWPLRVTCPTEIDFER